VPEDAIAAISPYLTEHINRFGDYTLNLGRKPPSPTTATLSDGPPQPHETRRVASENCAPRLSQNRA
jgi:hypothetical protein